MNPLDQLQSILNTIQGTTTADLQTPDQCTEYITQLSGWLAYSAEQVALTGKILNIAKRDAYMRLQQEYDSKNVKFSPSLAKDYINSMLSREQFAYDLAERTNRTIVHVIEAMRSVLSSKKSEREFARYNS